GQLVTNATFYAEALAEYEANRTGPLTVARGNQAGFLPLKTFVPEWQTIISALTAQKASTYLPSTYDKNLTDGFAAQLNVTTSFLQRDDFAAMEFAFGAGPLGGGA